MARATFAWTLLRASSSPPRSWKTAVITGPRPGGQAMAMLRAVISPFILRRLKQQVLTELPDKTEIIHHISLSPEERQLYEATRRAPRETVPVRTPLTDLKASEMEALNALIKKLGSQAL